MAASRTRLDLNSQQHSSPLPCIEWEGVVIPEPKKIAEMLNKPHFNDRLKDSSKIQCLQSFAFEAHNSLDWKQLHLRRRFHRCITIFKCLHV